jgi:hypothetical protein
MGGTYRVLSVAVKLELPVTVRGTSRAACAVEPDETTQVVG